MSIDKIKAEMEKEGLPKDGKIEIYDYDGKYLGRYATGYQYVIAHSPLITFIKREIF